MVQYVMYAALEVECVTLALTDVQCAARFFCGSSFQLREVSDSFFLFVMPTDSAMSSALCFVSVQRVGPVRGDARCFVSVRVTSQHFWLRSSLINSKVSFIGILPHCSTRTCVRAFLWASWWLVERAPSLSANTFDPLVKTQLFFTSTDCTDIQSFTRKKSFSLF